MRISRVLISVLLAVPLSVFGQQGLSSSPDSLSGNDSALGITYSSVQNGNDVAVSLAFNNKQISAQIDYVRQIVRVQCVSATTGQIASLTQAEINNLNGLLRRIQPANSRVNDALMSTLNFLVNFDPGAVVDIDTSASKAGSVSPSPSITSLCASIGSQVMGTYTLGSHTFVQTAICGPCGSGDCLGRCGPGCGPPPSPSVQRFTQECLNHDLCAGRTGYNLGPCADEFIKAAPGFFFATDCANMTGNWVDNYLLEWALTETNGSISGSVPVPNCGNWTVSGSRSTFDVTLTATNPDPNNGCCTAFTYTGSEQCNSAVGSWTNECGLTGSWSMTREGANQTKNGESVPVAGPKPSDRK